MDIEKTLRDYAVAYLEEKRLSKDLSNIYHDTCWNKTYVTSLARYFAWTKENKNYKVDYWQYCEITGDTVCEKCAMAYLAVIARKVAKKKIVACKGAITRYALSLVEK